MRRREKNPRERLASLAGEYPSKKSLYQSIAKTTGQSERTVRRHFEQGKNTESELKALKRREKYAFTEKPRQRARAFRDRGGEGPEKIGGVKVSRSINEETGRFKGRGAIVSSDLLEANGLDAVFVMDFAQSLQNGEVFGIDLDSDEGRKFIATFRIVIIEKGEGGQGPSIDVDYRQFTLNISDELPADIRELFRKIYKEGTGASVEIV